MSNGLKMNAKPISTSKGIFLKPKDNNLPLLNNRIIA